MDRHPRNMRKLAVLGALALEPDWVSAARLRFRRLVIAMTLRNLEMALLRYLRWGLVERKPNYSGRFLYRITDKGRDRLVWLRKQHAL